MKLSKVSLFVILVAAACLPAAAQAPSFNVPFNFVASGKALPAGQYKIQRVFEKNQSAWRIYSAKDSVMLLTASVESPQTSHPLSLVFVRVGEGYALSQFWNQEHDGQEFLRIHGKQNLIAKDAQYVEVGAE